MTWPGVGPVLGASRGVEVHGARIRCEKDVLECARCKGRLALVATITPPSVIQAMLECIGLPARSPPLGPARGAWEEELDFDGA